MKVASLNSLWSTAMFQFHYNAVSPPWCKALSEKWRTQSLPIKAYSLDVEKGNFKQEYITLSSMCLGLLSGYSLFRAEENGFGPWESEP